MMGKNYELIYKVRAAGVNTNSLSNLEIGYITEAKRRARIEHEKYLEFLRKELGSNITMEVTNLACSADGIIGCVFVSNGVVPRGVGHRTCCFCGERDD